MGDPVRSGRRPGELSRAFEPSAAALAGWGRRAAADDGTCADTMTTAEREDLSRLRRETRQPDTSGNLALSGVS
jgi:transposase